MKSSLWSLGCCAIAVAAGCSTAFSTGTGTGGSGSTTSSSSSSSTTSSSGTGGKGTTTSSTSTTTKSTTTSTSTTITGNGCPPEAGVYTLSQSGMGCQDLDITAKECIKATGVPCSFDFVTEAGMMGNGVEGSVTVGPLGDFGAGAVTLGSVMRTGCVGAWKPGLSAQNAATMTIDCGGVGTSQSCVVVLTRAGDVCPF